jgi:hypothetical protein
MAHDDGAGALRARLVLVLTGVVLAAGASACSGDGVSLPTVSRTGGSVALPSPSLTLPSLTRSPSAGPTADPTTEEPEPTTEEPEPTARPPISPPERSTATVTATASAPPPATVTQEPGPRETATVTQEATPSPSPSPSSTDVAAGEPAQDDGISPWWLLLAALLAAGAVALLVQRSRRRAAWQQDLAAQEAEVDWLAHDLLPRLQTTVGPDALAGGWLVASERVLLTEDRLTELQAKGPDEEGTTRARALRDAVRSTRTGVEDVIAARDPASQAAELARLATRLDAVAHPATPRGGPAPASP